MTYEINGWVKTIERDNWRDGCHGGANCFGGNDIFKGDTAEDAIQKACNFVGVDYEDIDLNACEEAGRVDINLTENADGYPATPSEIEAWKAGEIDLWLANYTFYVEFVTRNPAII